MNYCEIDFYVNHTQQHLGFVYSSTLCCRDFGASFFSFIRVLFPPSKLECRISPANSLKASSTYLSMKNEYQFGCLGTHFVMFHVVIFGELFGNLLRHLTILLQVVLVAHNHQVDVFVGEVLDLLQPILAHIFK